MPELDGCAQPGAAIGQKTAGRQRPAWGSLAQERSRIRAMRSQNNL